MEKGRDRKGNIHKFGEVEEILIFILQINTDNLNKKNITVIQSLVDGQTCHVKTKQIKNITTIYPETKLQIIKEIY